MARYDRRKLNEWLRDPGIVRNRLKLASARQNARAFLKVQKEFGSFDSYVRQFGGGAGEFLEVPAAGACPDGQSDAMSKDLRKRGFAFVGSTICYAFMQAVGMVNDHWRECFRYREISRRRSWSGRAF